ncbi:carbon monoxide dehydrogenase subunit G (CoxG) family protein [Flexivirga endophytica]|uniref:Carbon monoxide dehydrogenase subunit G (CoxG) family protein n=1 Tax=Flexivirga endophytica TaxID=1849103 RepID=A0A916SZG7_9MICO|nr:SRPBCC family protein [Flexivirga endophytica]GGB21468.1 carbon monoxide dehydrogenase subunit G (CoxG) family protein [Flexivirga endophytica]GHB59122.1 carbon monoxide dehydrogenase subunit G (CoxG) family protein [Flexivirga endophytica]
MQLVNEFEVELPPEQAWTLLTDVEKVAPCLPGASITSVDGDEFHGQAKIKVGPITAQYKGVAQFTELDESARRAVLLARGKDSRGQGDATATVTAHLNPSGTGTRVTVETDLALTGKVAQFGRGVLADVSGALMGLFAQRLQEMVAAESGPGTAIAPQTAPAAPQDAPVAGPTITTPAPVPAPRIGGDDEVLDVLALAGGASWSKLLPAGGTVVSVAAALISVFAAGYAAARARSGGH